MLSMDLGTYFMWALLALMVLYIIRAVMGPSIWDRILAFNLITTKVVMLIIIYASLADTAFLMDFAIIYALSGFIGAIFLAIFNSERRIDKRKRKESGE